MNNLDDFKVSPNGLITTIAITERFDASVAKAFPDYLLSLCHNHSTTEVQPNKIVLDFSRTNFIDSSGIGALVKGLKVLNEKNISLVVSKVSKQVHSVLKMTGLEQLLITEKEDTLTTNSQASANDLNNIPETHPSIRSKSKRFIDILGSLVGLSITALLFIPIAVAIKLDSPGPLLFSQTRLGLLGSKFKIYKFRTMGADAEARKNEVKNESSGAIFKCSNDPRVTTVGNFLRRTSLDELPQFWNVLEGSMSLIGTRPPTIDELEQYNIPHWQRLDVKPGISGEWQVNGRSGIKNFEDIIKMDLDYQRKWSLFYDLKLILKTVVIIFSKDSGAM